MFKKLNWRNLTYKYNSDNDSATNSANFRNNTMCDNLSIIWKLLTNVPRKYKVLHNNDGNKKANTINDNASDGKFTRSSDAVRF